MIRLLYDQAKRPKLKDRIFLSQPLTYLPADKLDPDDAKAVTDAFKLNALLLAAIKSRIDAALGSGRFAVLLVPTKLEFGHYLKPGSDRNRVADEVLASLARLGVPAIDGRSGIVEGDFWKVDMHWRASGHKKIGEMLAAFLAEARGANPGSRPLNAAH
jgi:hypothetical protein